MLLIPNLKGQILQRFSKPCYKIMCYLGAVIRSMSRPMFFLMPISLVVVAETVFAGGAKFYVDNLTGNDRYDGSFSSPWLSLPHALKHLRPGDTLFMVANGPQQPYRGKLSLKQSGTAFAPIKIVGIAKTSAFTGASGNPPFIVGSVDISIHLAQSSSMTTLKAYSLPSSLQNFSGVLVSSAAEWEKSGILALSLRRETANFKRIKPGEWFFDTSRETLFYQPMPEENASAVHLELIVGPKLLDHYEQDYVEYKNLSFRFSSGNAVSVYGGATNIKLDKISISESGKNGLSIKNGHSISITNCTISDVKNNGIVLGGSKESPLSNTYIANCDIFNVANNDCITLHKGKDGESIGSVHTLENNRLSHCREQGLDITSGQDVRLINNLTFNNGGSGILLGKGVKNIYISKHASHDEGEHGGIVIGRSSAVQLMDSCVIGGSKRQLRVLDASDVTIKGGMFVQYSDDRGSMVDIAGQSTNINFINNIVVSQSTKSLTLLRFLTDKDFGRPIVNFDKNIWSSLSTQEKHVYTRENNRHSFASFWSDAEQGKDSQLINGMNRDKVSILMADRTCQSI